MMKAYNGDKLEEEEKSDQDTSSIGEKPCEQKKSNNTSDDTSSIGEASDDDEEEEEEMSTETSSKCNGGALASLGALERALPIKRGISNFFDGRLRSFKCLTDILGATAEDLVKPENPLNKRRKLLNIQKRSFCVAPSPPRPSLPPTISMKEDNHHKDKGKDLVKKHM